MISHNQQEHKMTAPGALQPSPSVKFIGPVKPEDMIIARKNLTFEADKQDKAQKKKKERSFSNYYQNIPDQYRQRSRSPNNKRPDQLEDRPFKPVLETPRMHMMMNAQMGGPQMLAPQSVIPQNVIPQSVIPQNVTPQMERPPMGLPPEYMGNMSMMPGMVPIMQYPMMSDVISPQMEHSMPGIHNKNVPHMVPNVTHENMVINQNICEPIIISRGLLLPPIPGVSTPQRREKPNGCRTIYAGGLPNLSLDDLHEIFYRFGFIERIWQSQRGLYYICFESPICMEKSFMLTGYRFKLHEQTENEATTMFIDYTLNIEDQKEYDRANQEVETQSVEDFSRTALYTLIERMEDESEFLNVTRTVAVWMESGKCNNKFANGFYFLIQTCNTHVERLINEKKQIVQEFLDKKNTLKYKFARVLNQFEHVAKVLSAANHHKINFTIYQRKNIEMWFTAIKVLVDSILETDQAPPFKSLDRVHNQPEKVEIMKEEFNIMFDDEDIELKLSRNMASVNELEELKNAYENMSHELEAYKNELHLAKDEAERKFERFKAHFIARERLQNIQEQPTLSTQYAEMVESGPSVTPSEAKLISILAVFFLVHPLGASLDDIFSYVKSRTANVAIGTVLDTLHKYKDVFTFNEDKWVSQIFGTIKMTN